MTKIAAWSRAPQNLFHAGMGDEIVGCGRGKHADHPNAVDDQADNEREGQSADRADQQQNGGRQAEKQAHGVDASIRNALEARIGRKNVMQVVHPRPVPSYGPAIGPSSTLMFHLVGGNTCAKAAQAVRDNTRHDGNADAHDEFRVHLETACVGRLCGVTDETDDVIGDGGDR